MSLDPSVPASAPRRHSLVHTERLEQLYSAHMTQLVRFAYFMTGDRELAQDVAHETFVKVFGRLARLRDPERTSIYLRRTLINLVYGHFRRLRLHRRYLSTEAQRAAQHHSLPDVATNRTLVAALQSIHPRRRAVVVLRYYEDLSEIQVAEALGCSVAAVKALAARGLEDLRTKMEGEEHGIV